MVVSDRLPSAALNFNGLSFDNDQLRDLTVLALSITGDAVGATTVGGVRRFQAWGPSLTSGGNILAPITATASSDPAGNADSPLDQYQRISPSIGFITATNAIDAPIWAPSGSILHVDIGPNPDCLGLRSSVIAGVPPVYTDVSITEILSAGPITLGETEEIFSGLIIRHVRAGVPAGDGQPAVPRPIVARIHTSLNEFCKSMINLVETDSTFTGSIATDYMFAPTDLVRVPGEPLANRDWGVRTGLTLDGSVYVHCDMTKSAISADDFAPGSTVYVGKKLQGTVEARTGTLTSVEVGYRVDYESFASTNYDPDLTPVENGDALVDSVIRSPQRIESIRLAGMAMSLPEIGYPPRVESPIIGALEIGNAAALSLGFEAGTVRADDSDGYATLGQCTILQGASLAKMYVNDFGSLDILHNWGGLIRMPTLMADRVVRIGDRLTTVQADYDSQFPISPGRIWVEQHLGDTGQVVINAQASTDVPDDAFWDGFVDVGPFDGVSQVPEFRFTTTVDAESSEQEIAPYYQRNMPAIGGGAMGLVPYHTQCRHTGMVGAGAYPDNGASCAPQDSTLQSEFSRYPGRTPKRLEISFYGPVWSDWALGVGERSPIRVEKDAGIAGWIDFTEQCYIVVNRAPSTTLNRQVTVYGRTAGSLTTMMPAGDYRVRLDDAPGQSKSVYCDWLLDGVTPVEVASNGTDRVLAEFSLAKDCNGDGVPDSSGDCETAGQCPADLADSSGSAIPDGGVTVDDLLYFLNAFESGVIDLDDGSGDGVQDQATTIDDLLYFLYHFGNGC